MPIPCDWCRRPVTRLAPQWPHAACSEPCQQAFAAMTARNTATWDAYLRDAEAFVRSTDPAFLRQAWARMLWHPTLSGLAVAMLDGAVPAPAMERSPW